VGEAEDEWDCYKSVSTRYVKAELSSA
jgi:hypothetical protein